MDNTKDLYQTAAIEAVRFMASHTAAEVSIMTLRKAYEIGFRHGYSRAVIDQKKPECEQHQAKNFFRMEEQHDLRKAFAEDFPNSWGNK